LTAAGVLLLLAAASMQLYSMYAEMRWTRSQQGLSAQFLPAPAALDIQPLQPEASTATPGGPAPATPAGVTAGRQATPPATTPAAAEASTPVLPPTPTPTPDDRRDPGRLLIPKLKVNTQIVVVAFANGQWDVSHILYEAGLLDGTGWPGRPGNAALSGHVSLKGRGDGPFRWLEKLAPGDEVIVEQGAVRYTYRVSQTKVVLPSDVSVLEQTEQATLTLVTCTDWDFLRAEYSKRLIVSAKLASQSTPGPQ
jgi:sortase A